MAALTPSSFEVGAAITGGAAGHGGGRLDRVAEWVGAAGRPLVGRAGEVAAVVGLVHGAARSEAGALLVAGEAGVGKTVLVREACARVGEGADLIWGSCPPLTSLAVPTRNIGHHAALPQHATDVGILRGCPHDDRARGNLDRHGVQFLTAYVAGA
jgi:hypothetical protein